MVKPVTSEVRKLLFRILSNFQHVKEQQDSVLKQKRECLQNIEALTVSLFVLQAESYVLMTANVDDLRSLAQQALKSPIATQLKDIWRGASQSFNSHYTRFRAQEDESDNTDATYELARKVLKSPLAQRVKEIWRSASKSFKKHYRAQDSSAESGRESASNDQRRSVERRKAMNEFIELGRNASVYLRSMKEMFERL